MKLITILLLSLLIFISGYCQDVRECVVQSYQAEIGVRELSGRNDGKEVEKYLASVKLGKGFAWCASFVNYNLQKCGANHAGSAWSPDWFPKNRITHNPLPGDVFGIYFPDKKRIAHVGFVLHWGENKTTTVEGNTNSAGSREGDGVYRKIRMTKQIYMVANWIDP